MDEATDRRGFFRDKPIPGQPRAAAKATLDSRALNERQMVGRLAMSVQRRLHAMRAIHWATVAFCLGSFLIAWSVGNSARAEGGWLVMLHPFLQPLIVPLAGLGLLFRMSTKAEPSASQASSVERSVGRASLIALYVLLAAQPLMSLTASMLSGNRILVFGGIEVPSFFAVDEPLARRVFEARGWVGVLLLALVVGRAGAALGKRLMADRRATDPRPGLLATCISRRREYSRGASSLQKRQPQRADEQQ